MNPLFSIIIPVYNVEQYLEDCVESVLVQSEMLDQVEIILIDDGSRDNSGLLCDRLAEKYEKVLVFHKENGGLSSARNCGVENASGEYVMFLDSDDVIESNTLQKLQDAVLKNPGTDVIVFDGVEDDKKSRSPMRRLVQTEIQCFESGKEYLLFQYQRRNLNVEACLHVWRRAYLKDHNIHFTEGILHEDVEFTPRALLECGKVVSLPDQFYRYMVRENSISTQKNKEKNARDLFATLRAQDQMADQQESELRKWMKNAILDSYLNMIQTARMYQKQYRKLVDKRFLLGKATTNWNRFRVLICFVNLRLYCFMNDFYKRTRS